MDDSIKGVLIMVTVISLFITSILSFITLFPQEQGYTFSSSENNTYLTIQDLTDTTTTSSYLDSVKNSSDSSFDNWDITVGYMGSNSMKQGTKTSINSYSTSIFSTLKIIATQLFGKNSPVLYVIAILLSLSISVIVYLTYKFIRTGN